MAKTENPDSYRHLVEEWKVTGEARCELCGLVWPETKIEVQDSFRVCPNCYEKNGGIITRDKRRAAASRYAASREAARKQPKWPYAIEEDAAVTEIDHHPLDLVAGGAADTMILSGTGLTATALSLAYPLGITDSVAPVFASDGTSVTLTLTAAAGMAPGTYSLSLDGSTWQNMVRVVDS